MAYNNKMIDSMMAYSADAFKNMYDIYIDWPGSLSAAENNQNLISVRAKGIKIPDLGAATYDRHYHGNKIALPKPEQEFERNVEITFTMDAGFQYYQNFCKWLSVVVDAVNGGTSNWPALRGTLYAVPLKGIFLPAGYESKTGADGTITNNITAATNSKVINPSYINGTPDGSDKAGALNLGKVKDFGWKFSECWVSKVTAPDFAVDSSEPLEFTVTFQFLDYDAPAFGGFRNSQNLELGGTN